MTHDELLAEAGPLFDEERIDIGHYPTDDSAATGNVGAMNTKQHNAALDAGRRP